MAAKKAAAKLTKRVLRAAGAGDLVELQQLAAAAAAAAAPADADAEPGAAALLSLAPPPLLEVADADECQPLVRRLSPRSTRTAPAQL